LVIKNKILSVVLFALAFSSSGLLIAQDREFNEPMVTAQNRPDGTQPGRNRMPGKRAGDWLRKYQNLTPQEQDRLLSSDPQFQQLPADRQSNLRNHLRNFTNLPPEKKQQMLDRMTKFENLPPAQREQLKKLHQQMHQISENRRDVVKAEARNLREMSPQDRERALNSDRFRNSFSDVEKNLIKGLSEVPTQPSAGSVPPAGNSAPPK
jgi:hypothetical protein